MNIREAKPDDIPSLVSLDRASYGKFGADETYFQKKFIASNTHILVTEHDKKITGFVVFEVVKPGQKLKDFSDLTLDSPIRETWMHIIAFTTKSNFKDIQSDTALLQAAEQKAKNLGCTLFGVPLSIDHPYRKNDVFGFWKNNGYQKSGTIKWIAENTETIDCYFYLNFSLSDF